MYTGQDLCFAERKQLKWTLGKTNCCLKSLKTRLRLRYCAVTLQCAISYSIIYPFKCTLTLKPNLVTTFWISGCFINVTFAYQKKEKRKRNSKRQIHCKVELRYNTFISANTGGLRILRSYVEVKARRV